MGRKKSGMEGIVFTSSGLNLSSVYTDVAGSEPPLTTKTASFEGCLDYVWVAKECFQSVEVLEMPYVWKQEKNVNGGGEGINGGGVEGDSSGNSVRSVEDLEVMPNEWFPSDHIAIGAKIQYKK